MTFVVIYAICGAVAAAICLRLLTDDLRRLSYDGRLRYADVLFTLPAALFIGALWPRRARSLASPMWRFVFSPGSRSRSDGFNTRAMRRGRWPLLARHRHPAGVLSASVPPGTRRWEAAGLLVLALGLLIAARMWD